MVAQELSNHRVEHPYIGTESLQYSARLLEATRSVTRCTMMVCVCRFTTMECIIHSSFDWVKFVSYFSGSAAFCECIRIFLRFGFLCTTLFLPS